MLKKSRKFISALLAFVVATQPILAVNGYKHHVYIPGLRVSGDPVVDPNNPGGTDPSNAADLVLSTSNLTFTDTEVGQEVSLQIQITNFGADTPLNIQTGTAIFAATHNCGTSLVKNESCIISVRFAPNAGKVYSEVLTVAPLTGVTKTATLSGKGLGAVLSATPKILTFDDTFVSTSQVKTLTITNTGNRSALMGGTTFDGNGYSLDSTTCVDQLEIGQSCALGVRFTPSSSGFREAILSLSANTGAGTTVANINLQGTGLDTPLSMPKTKDFEALEVGLSVTKAVFLTNRGTSPLTIDVVSVVGAGFSGTGCTGSLAPGARCDVPVTFTPTDTGAFNGEVRVSQGGKTVVTTLVGVGTRTAVPQVTPNSLGFGAVTVGTATSPQTVTLSNIGTTALGITRFSEPEGYQTTSNCSSSLSPGENCEFQVLSNAVKNGPQSKSFIIYTSAGAQTVSLSGTATGGLEEFLLSTDNLAFPDTDVGVTSAPLSVLITNTAVQPVEIFDITIAGAYAATTSCASSLGPNEQCAISVTFTPDSVKSFNKNIAIKSSMGVSSIPVYGKGIAPQLTVIPTGIDFGNIAGVSDIPSQILDVKASGGKDVVLSGISITNSVFTQTNNCPGTLPAGTSCKVSVAMTPGVEGLSEGALSVQSNSASSPNSATLSAANKTYVATITNTTVDFGAVTMSSNTAQNPTADITIKNTGVAAMTLTGVSPDNEDVLFKSHNCTNIAPQASCTMTVALSLAKPKSIFKTMKTRGPGVNAEFVVKGLVQGVAARWINGSIDFGFVGQGETSTQSVLLSNQGNIIANFSSIQFNNSVFTANASACGNVAPNQNCFVAITYSPTNSSTVTGSASGISSVGNFIWNGDPLYLTGSSVVKKITPSASTVDLGSIMQGETSDIKSVQILNDSDIALTNLGITAPEGYVITTDCLPNLAVNATCNISVKLNSIVFNRPAGAFSSNLSIRSTQASTAVKMTGYLADAFTVKASPSLGLFLPVDLSYGRVDLGSSKSMNFNVIAQGTAGKLVTSATISGPNAAEFTWTKVVKINPTTRDESDCAATIGSSSFTLCTSDAFSYGDYKTVSSAQTYTLQVTPTLPTGDKNATINFSYSDGSTETIPVTVAVPSLANASVSTDLLQFSPTDANTTSQLTVRLSNTGTETLVIKSAPALGGSSVFTFPTTGGTNCGASLAPGAFCDTTVNFKPIDESVSNATLTIETNDFDGPTVINVTGTGLQGVGAISVQGGGGLSYGVVPIGNKVKKVYLFSNIGTKAVTDTYASLTGNPASLQYVNAESTCGTVSAKTPVAAGASCAITIEYSPKTQGEVLSGVNLTVYSTARNNPVVQSINGSAGGTVVLNVTDSSNAAITTYDYGAVNKGANPTYTVKYTNAGTAPVLFSATPSVAGNPAFTAISNSCTSTLAAGANCTLVVKFTPTVTTEVKSTVSATHNGGTSTVALRGTGNIPSATLTGANYAFGSVEIGKFATKTFTLTNTGNVTLSGLTSTTTDPTITIDSTTCTSIPAAGTCSVVLKYAPTASVSIAAGVASFKLTAFTANDLSVTLPANLTGTGFAIINGTWNPLEKATSITLSNANLTAYGTGGGAGVRGQYAASTGVKYHEVRIDSVNTANSNGPTSWIGFSKTSAAYTSGVGSNSSYVGLSGQTTGFNPGTSVGKGGSASSKSFVLKVGDIVGLKLDLDNRIMEVYVNGVLQATTTNATTTATDYLPLVAPNSAQTTANFGQTPFNCTACKGSATTWSQ